MEICCLNRLNGTLSHIMIHETSSSLTLRSKFIYLNLKPSWNKDEDSKGVRYYISGASGNSVIDWVPWVQLVVVVVLLFYVHGKHLRSCRDGHLT